MSFSEHNQNINYTNHYGGLLEANGNGVLVSDDLFVFEKDGKE